MHLVVDGANKRAVTETPGFNILWQCLISIVTANMCSSHSWRHFKFSLIPFNDYAVLSDIEETQALKNLAYFLLFPPLLLLLSPSSPHYFTPGSPFSHYTHGWAGTRFSAFMYPLLLPSPPPPIFSSNHKNKSPIHDYERKRAFWRQRTAKTSVLQPFIVCDYASHGKTRISPHLITLRAIWFVYNSYFFSNTAAVRL